MLSKGFKMTPENEKLILKKNAAILKLEECLNHGNGDGCLQVVRLYSSPNDARKMDKEGKNPEGKTTAKMEGMASTTTTATIKRDMRVEAEVKEKKMEPCVMTDCATAKRLRYHDKQTKEYETGSIIVPICQEMQTEETAT